MDWNQIKEAIAYWTELERDALHIYAALLAQVGTALALRLRLSHGLPWAAVLVLALGNEWLDTYGDGLVEQWELDSGVHDLWNTMLLPTILLILARFAPGLFAARAVPDSSGLSDSEDPLHRASSGPPPPENRGSN